MASIEHPDPQRDPYAGQPQPGEPAHPGAPGGLRVVPGETLPPHHLPPPGAHAPVGAEPGTVQLAGPPETFLPPPPPAGMQEEVESTVDALLSYSPEQLPARGSEPEWADEAQRWAQAVPPSVAPGLDAHLLPGPGAAPPFESVSGMPEPAPQVHEIPVVDLGPTVPVAPEPAPLAAEPPPAPFAQDPDAAMRDVPLGTLVHRAGLLNAAQVEEALAESVRQGRRLGEVLLDRGLIDERDLGRLLAGQKGLPFVDLRSIEIDPTASSLLPHPTARLYLALPIRIEEGVPVVAVADPTNQLAIENVRRALGVEPRFAVASRTDVLRSIAIAHGLEPEEAAAPAVAATPTPEPAVAHAVLPDLQPEPTPLAPDAPLPPLREPEPVARLEPAASPVDDVLRIEIPVVADMTAAAVPGPAPEIALAPPVAAPVVEASPPVLPVELPLPANGTLRVVVRLADGERIDVGTYGTGTEATARARSIMRLVDERDGGDWPFLDGRFLRPDTIVSVDLVEDRPRY